MRRANAKAPSGKGAKEGLHPGTARAGVSGAMAAALMLMGLVHAEAERATNPIPNPGIETASAMDTELPAQWTPHARGEVACSWSTKEPHSGTRCLEMVTDPEEKNGHAYWESDAFAVTPCVAYRVSFWFRAAGYGIPIFALDKVKEWRVERKGDTGGWVQFEDVVVVPPEVSETKFIAHNYHRRGKTIWVDDVEMLELPLAESPLTQRLARARSAVSALLGNVAKLALTDEQTADVESLRTNLESAEVAYAKLKAGDASAEDFKTANASLDAIEQALGSCLFTVWAISSEDWERGKRAPKALGRQCEVESAAPAEGILRQFIGVMCLIDEGLPGQLTVGRDRATRDWEVRLLTTPTYRDGAPATGPADGFEWGTLNSFGELFLPPGVPRFVQIEVVPGKAKPGKYRLRLSVDCLDRPTDVGEVALSAAVEGTG